MGVQIGQFLEACILGHLGVPFAPVAIGRCKDGSGIGVTGSGEAWDNGGVVFAAYNHRDSRKVGDDRCIGSYQQLGTASADVGDDVEFHADQSPGKADFPACGAFVVPHNVVAVSAAFDQVFKHVFALDEVVYLDALLLQLSHNVFEHVVVGGVPQEDGDAVRLGHRVAAMG